MPWVTLRLRPAAVKKAGGIGVIRIHRQHFFGNLAYCLPVTLVSRFCSIKETLSIAAEFVHWPYWGNSNTATIDMTITGILECPSKGLPCSVSKIHLVGYVKVSPSTIMSLG